MKIRLLILLTFFVVQTTPVGSNPFSDKFEQTTWANWERQLEDGFEQFPARRLSGSTMGIIIPFSNRKDLIPLTTLGYEVLDPPSHGTIIILMPAPQGYPLNGLVFPETDVLKTTFGNFYVDDFLKQSLQNIDQPIFVDDTPFGPILPYQLELQLAALKHVRKGRTTSLKILPIIVNFQNPNAQARDLGLYIVDSLRQIGFEESVKFIVLSNLTVANSREAIIPADAQLLSAFHDLNIDSTIHVYNKSKEDESSIQLSHIGPLSLGIVMLKLLGASHGEVLAYANSSQLFLTKDKSRPEGYASAGFTAAPFNQPKIPHVVYKKIYKVFDEDFRNDILEVTRQTCAVKLNPVAAKPPTLVRKQAKKKWPVYVSLYNPQGELAGEAGSHKGVASLQESLSKFAFEATQKAQPELTKDNFSDYTVEVTIPYGFETVKVPEELLPLSNGIVIHKSHQSFGFSPNAWRKFPDPHQLLGASSYELNMPPWSYATKKAKIESFRVLSFNEKEPFKGLGTEKKKKKKKKKRSDDIFGDDDIGGGDGGFTF